MYEPESELLQAEQSQRQRPAGCDFGDGRERNELFQGKAGRLLTGNREVMLLVLRQTDISNGDHQDREKFPLMPTSIATTSG